MCIYFYFQKQNYKLLSLNNKHVGAKLNRDQTIIKTIQKTIENASGIRKNNKKQSLLMRPRHKTGPARLACAALRPSTRQPTAGPPNQPGAAPLPFSLGPNSARLAPRSSLGRRIRSDGRPPLPRDQNPTRRRCHPNPRSFYPSPFSLHVSGGSH